MLMFKRTFWRNHVEDQDGKVIQQGTLLEQDQFNRMEVGISDSNMAANIIHIMLLWFGRRLGVLETSSNRQGAWGSNPHPPPATTPTLPASRP